MVYARLLLSLMCLLEYNERVCFASNLTTTTCVYCYLLCVGCRRQQYSDVGAVTYYLPVHLADNRALFFADPKAFRPSGLPAFRPTPFHRRRLQYLGSTQRALHPNVSAHILHY